MPGPSAQAAKGGQTALLRCQGHFVVGTYKFPGQIFEMTRSTRLALSGSIDTCRSRIAPESGYVVVNPRMSIVPVRA